MIKHLNILFHEVTDNPSKTGLVRKSALPYKHTVAQFQSYLDVLKEYSESAAIPNSREWNSTESIISISFDDGGASNMKSVELLEEIGFKSSIFVITDKISKPGFLTKQEIQSLKSRGHIIGSHSHTHPNVFSNLSKDQMEYEWKTSRNILENIVGEEIHDCSIPGGDASGLVYQIAAEAGYKRLFDSEPITDVRMYGEMEIYGRFCLKNTHSSKTLNSWIKGDGLVKYQRIWELKKMIKKVAYPIYVLKRKFDTHDG